MKRKRNYICQECQKSFLSSGQNPKFCSHSCSASYNGKRRTQSKESKLKISKSLKNHYEKFPPKKTDMKKQYVCEACGESFLTTRRFRKERYVRCDKCIRQCIHAIDLSDVNSILNLAKKTTAKIIKKMKIGCSRCGWNESTGDIHHINGKKIEDCDNHKNLTYLCPNCHRLAHTKKINKETLINLTELIGDWWKEFYNKKMVE